MRKTMPVRERLRVYKHVCVRLCPRVCRLCLSYFSLWFELIESINRSCSCIQSGTAVYLRIALIKNVFKKPCYACGPFVSICLDGNARVILWFG